MSFIRCLQPVRDADPPVSGGGAASPPANPPAQNPPAQNPPANPPASNPPTLIFGKYANMEEATRAFNEQQASLTRTQQELAALRNPPKPSSDPAPASSDGITIPLTDPNAQAVDIDGILKMAGLDGKAVAAQWTKDGKLTDDQYAAFGKVTVNGAPLSKPMIDAFVGGRHAQAQLAIQQQTSMRTQAEQMVGGKAQLDNLTKHIGQSKGLTAEQKKDLQDRLRSPAQWQGAMFEMITRYNQEIGASGTRIIVGTTGNIGSNLTGAKAFGSPFEIVQAAKAARAKSGSEWNDPDFKARYDATSPEIKNNVSGVGKTK